MSFFEEVNGKTVDEAIQEIADGKTSAMAFDRRDFTDEQYQKLCDAIKKNKKPLQIFLSDLSKEADVDMLFEVISQNDTVSKLVLQNTDLSGQKMKKFADVYEKHHQLTGIFFKNTNIGDEEATQLAQALKNKMKQEKYQAKDFSGRELDKEVVSGRAKQINSIRLNQNHIGNTGAKALAEVLEHGDNLEVFIVSNNDIEDEGVFAIAEAMKNAKALKKLDVSGNPFSPSGTAALAAVAKEIQSLEEYAGFEI